MIFNYKKVSYITAGVATVLLVYKIINDQTEIRRLMAINADYVKMKEIETADIALGQYAINMMYHAGAGNKISNARKQTLARSIVKTANDVYDSIDHKKAFIAVIAIESSFQRFAQSPTGPKGLSQVAKAAFKEGLALCGIPTADDEDVWDTDINLYAGACYFRNLLEKNNGDPYIAIVAYNKGPNSDSIKTYAKNGSLNDVEALKYVAKFNFLKRTVPEGKIPNIPAFEATSNTDKVKLIPTENYKDDSNSKYKQETKNTNYSTKKNN